MKPSTSMQLDIEENSTDSGSMRPTNRPGAGLPRGPGNLGGLSPDRLAELRTTRTIILDPDGPTDVGMIRAEFDALLDGYRG